METELGSPDMGAFNLNQADFQVWSPKAAEPCAGACGNEQTRDTLKELLLLRAGLLSVDYTGMMEKALVFFTSHLRILTINIF